MNGDDKFLSDYALENITIANLVASSNITKDVSPNNYGICVKAENIAISPSMTSFDIDIKTTKTTHIIKDVVVNAPGVHHVRNATFAFICAAALNADFEKVKEGIASYEPMVITRYVLSVCAAFNRFYHECRIVGAESGEASKFRVSLTAAVKQVIGSALHLICLKTPEKI